MAVSIHDCYTHHQRLYVKLNCYCSHLLRISYH